MFILILNTFFLHTYEAIFPTMGTGLHGMTTNGLLPRWKDGGGGVERGVDNT